MKKELIKNQIIELIAEAKGSFKKEPLLAIDLLKQAFEKTIENNLIEQIGISKLDKLIDYQFKNKLYSESITYILKLLQYSKTANLTKWFTYHYYDLLTTAYLNCDNKFIALNTFIKKYIEHKKYFFAIGDFKTLQRFPIDKYDTNTKFIELLEKLDMKNYEKQIIDIVNKFVDREFVPFTKINQLYMNKSKLKAMLSINENEIDTIFQNSIFIDHI